MNRGPLFEAFNWAKLFNLPVLFVCEDNGYSVTLKTRNVTGGPPAIERVQAFGIPTLSVNGNDVLAVHEAAGDLLARVRAGSGPCFLHATTQRWYGHLAHDQQRYRDPAELAQARQDDCVLNAENWLLAKGVAAAELAQVREASTAQIAAAVNEALLARWPEAASALADVQDLGAWG